ncbi:MAG: hypothetical protein Kow0089_00460 [Desulfobulbaceae bacterium]
MFVRTLNRLLARLDLALVNRSVIYDWQVGEGTSPALANLPPGAEAYLRPDNPRLVELRERYRAFQAAASIPLVWTDEYVQSYSLQTFRGDNCYVWQTNDPNCDEIHYCLTAYYVQALDRLGLLEKNVEDGLFGAHTHAISGRVVSRDLLDSIIELTFLDTHLDLFSRPGITILDIGAGYGRLACRAACSLDNLQAYLCTDAVPESTFLSEYHTRFRQVDDRVQVVPLDEIEERLRKERIDLAVNIHSFSECSMDAVNWWLEQVAASRIPHLFIVPNAVDHGGQRLALNSGEDFSHLVERHGYRLRVREPKFTDPVVQRYGVSPTWYYLFELAR